MLQSESSTPTCSRSCADSAHEHAGDRRLGLPHWPELEEVDLALTIGVPTVLQVLDLIRPNFKIGEVFMAEEFHANNPKKVKDAFGKSLDGPEGVVRTAPDLQETRSRRDRSGANRGPDQVRQHDPRIGMNGEHVSPVAGNSVARAY